MKKYILGETCTIGKKRSIEYMYKIPNTPLKIWIYRRQFYNWALKQTKKQMEDWRQYSIDCFDHIPGHKESIIWECEYDILLDSLDKFSSYEEYLDDTVKEYIKHTIESVESSLLFDKNLLTKNEKIYIDSIHSVLRTVKCRLDRLILFNTMGNPPPQIIIDNEMEELFKQYKVAHSGTDSKTLEIFSRIKEDMEKKHVLELSKIKDKKKKKQLQEKITNIRVFCGAVELGGAPREDVYRKLKRLSGSGWSKQK